MSKRTHRNMRNDQANSKKRSSIASLMIGAVCVAIVLTGFNILATFKRNGDREPYWATEASWMESFAFCFLMFLVVSWPLHAIHQSPERIVAPIHRSFTQAGCIVSIIWLVLFLIAFGWASLRTFS